jgi:hypothetical protein
MRRSNVALRLQTSLLDEARRVSESEGVALNQFINVAVAKSFRRWVRKSTFASVSRADIPEAQRIPKRSGTGKPPVPGDEI